MTGLDGLHSLTKDSMCKYMARFYTPRIFSPERMEDIILATDARKKYMDIGTDRIRMATFMYLADNLAWVNICLFINADFRACFNDAIMIEKALLQVTREEYQLFREDMTLAADIAGLDATKTVVVGLDRYDDKIDMAIGARIEAAWQSFCNAGMAEVYKELSGSLDGEDLAETAFVVQNMLYFVNAMNHNGVFSKYVHIVIENVKRQLLSA